MDSSAVSGDLTWSVRRRYFPAVEGMRAVAAFSVMAGHLLLFGYSSGPLRDLGFWIGPYGLTIFFAISGFLLYRPFLAARAGAESVGDFFPMYLWRRVVRIFPAYWVALTLSTIWMSWEGVFTDHWWVYYGMLQTYSAHWFLSGLPQAWSLGVEFSFYLLLPFIAMLLAWVGLGSGRPKGLRAELGILVGIIVCSLAWRTGLGSNVATNRLDQNLAGCLGWFCIGMILAVAEVSHPSQLARLRGALAKPLPCWAGAAIIVIALAAELPAKAGLSEGIQVGLTFLLYGTAGGLALGPAIFGEGVRLVGQVLENKTLTFLGTISYGIYLWHWPFLVWASQREFILSLPFSFGVVCVVTCTGTLVMATASWYLIEKPLMKRAHIVKAFRHRRSGGVEVAVDPQAGS